MLRTKRTPPKTTPVQTTSGSNTDQLETPPIVHLYNSAPELNKQDHNDSLPPIITFRRPLKKKRTDDEEEVKNDETGSVLDQVKDILGSFTQDLASRFTVLQNSVSNIEKQNTDISKSIEFLSEKYDVAMTKIKTLEDEKKEDRKKIAYLEEKTEFLERKFRATGIEIRNVPIITQPDKKFETKEDLSNLLQEMGTSINVDIQHNDIKDIYRIKTGKEHKPIVAEFCSVIKKENVLAGIKNFNKGKISQQKFNTTHLNIMDQKKPVYVSELLTQKTQRLFFLSRDFAKANGFTYCWTSRGIVYLRKTEATQQIRINDEMDLANLAKSD